VDVESSEDGELDADDGPGFPDTLSQAQDLGLKILLVHGERLDGDRHTVWLPKPPCRGGPRDTKLLCNSQVSGASHQRAESVIVGVLRAAFSHPLIVDQWTGTLWPRPPDATGSVDGNSHGKVLKVGADSSDSYPAATTFARAGLSPAGTANFTAHLEKHTESGCFSRLVLDSVMTRS